MQLMKTTGHHDSDGMIFGERKQLMEIGKSMKRNIKDQFEYSVLCKTIRQCLKEDLLRYTMRKRLQFGERRKSIKKHRRNMALYRSEVTVFKDKDWYTMTNRGKWERFTKSFTQTSLLHHEYSFPVAATIGKGAIMNALWLMKSDKAWGKYETTEMLGNAWAVCFNRYLTEGKLHSEWKELNSILLHKKGG